MKVKNFLFECLAGNSYSMTFCLHMYHCMSVYIVRKDSTSAITVNEKQTIFSSVLSDSLNMFVPTSHDANREAYTISNNLINFCDEMADVVDEGRAVDIIYLNFSNPFDMVSHRSLIKQVADAWPE